MTPTHAHRWLILTLTPGGDGYVDGTCRECGAVKRFDGYFGGDRNPKWGGGTIAMPGSYPKRQRRTG